MLRRLRKVDFLRIGSLTASIAAHVLVLVVLLWQPGVVIQPRPVMKGTHGTSTVLVYSPAQEATPKQPDSQAHSSLKIPHVRKRQIERAENKAPVAQQESQGSAAPTTLAGTQYGSQSQGLTYGSEV